MISMIVAYSQKTKVIGYQNKIPWHIKEDFQHFKNYTMHKTILMGKNTYFSIGKPLPYRKTIIACNDEKLDIQHEDVCVVSDLFEVLKKYQNEKEELVVCGGAMIYRLALPYADKLIISEVKKEYQGDTFFPDFEDQFVLVSEEEKEEFIIKIYQRMQVKKDV